MITNLQLTNFKSWRSLKLNLGQITGLFGSNSSGKTSILQFLLLLKQTKDATDRALTIDMGGPKKYINLGSYQEMIYDHNIENSLIWNLEWTTSKELAIRDPEGHSKDILIKTSKIFTGAKVEKPSKGSLKTSNMTYGYHHNECAYKFSLTESERGYTLSTDMDYRFMRNSGRAWELPSPIKSYGFPDQTFTYFRNASFLSDFVAEYEKVMNSIYYLGPLREYPLREYTWTGSRPVDVGISGDKAIDAILAAKSQNEKRNLGHRRPRMEFDAFIAFWLKEIGLIHSFSVEEIKEDTGLYRVFIKKAENSPKALITDVGFGVSQILPVLVLLYYVPEGSIVLLEQPEIHLHPAVQAGLADIIINSIRTRNIQVVVESHSEYLLRRLQRRIAEDVISPSSVQLFFCEYRGNKSKLTNLELDLFGNITNWPKDFFGDSFSEIVAMQRAGIKRKLAS